MQSDSLAQRRRRRRGSADDPLTKVTFQIHESVMDQVRAAVDRGAAPSLNAFMERAADDLLRELRRVEVYEAYTFEVKIPPGVLDGRFGSIVMPQQIRTVSRLRLLDRLGTVVGRNQRSRHSLCSMCAGIGESLDSRSIILSASH